MKVTISFWFYENWIENEENTQNFSKIFVVIYINDGEMRNIKRAIIRYFYVL